ncbi:MAG: hypothetical protein L6Q33_02570 [Bacteriovoracaceae bacterium]|nr:hypothetical protein [Bacteriovoracaceae bacterium]
MNRTIYLSVILLMITSCSTMKRSIFYGGLSGISLGVAGSAALSPNKESIVPNMAIWGSLGALIGAGLGYFFFVDDPENRELPSMIQGNLYNNGKLKNTNSMGPYDLAPIKDIEAKIVTPKDSKKYKLESGPIPDHLKGKVQAPYIIEHEIPERVERLENGKAITIEKHKAWEVDYE